MLIRGKLKQRTQRRTNNQTNTIGVLTIVIILIGLLLYFTNEIQGERVLNSYCGDFGFYGKTLKLMKDGTFIFTYHGCSQSNGYVSGAWTIEHGIITLLPNKPDENLDNQYNQVKNQLLPINLTNEKFVVCDDYIDPWEKIKIE